MQMQKSRINWIIQGDRNTKFYHSITTRRMIRNRVQGIQNENRIWVKDHKGFSKTFCNHFRNIFTSQDNRQEDLIKNRIMDLNMPFLGPDQLEWLNSPFSPEEIKIAAFQFGPLKALGVDGKHGLFYQKFWHIIGNLTAASYLNLLNSGFLFKELNKKIITLILRWIVLVLYHTSNL